MIHNVRHRRKGELVNITFGLSPKVWASFVRHAESMDLSPEVYLGGEVGRALEDHHVPSPQRARKLTPALDDDLPF